MLLNQFDVRIYSQRHGHLPHFDRTFKAQKDAKQYSRQLYSRGMLFGRKVVVYQQSPDYKPVYEKSYFEPEVTWDELSEDARIRQEEGV
jgi:hypothetical protein